MGTITKENPWKGLNFYRETDKNDFYGREEDIERLSLYIINNAQTVLFGKSGIGKSSILNAGVFPVAREHGLFPVPIKLIHDNKKSYLQQIKDRINKFVERQGASIHELVPVIDEQSETLWEYLHRTIIYDSDGKRVRLLLVIDQFEEIFTLQQDDNTKEQFFAELADLLNDVTPLYIANTHNNISKGFDENTENQYIEKADSEIKIELTLDDKNEDKYLERSEFHIVLTLRDDFLGCLERYTTNIPCMKTNRYALQPLTKKQAEKIITMPRENLVADGVVELIIQRVTDKADNRLNGLSESSVDAAMLSLYLSRLYTKRNNDEEQITVELVQEFGDNIIKDFYEESVKDIPIKILEKIEDELLTYGNHRNNVSIMDFEMMGVPQNIIRSLVDDKKLLRQFNYGGDIRVEYMHDVLCKVVSERIEQRERNKKNRLIKYLWIALISALVIAIGFIISLKLDNQKYKEEKGYGISQKVAISFQEDSVIVSERELWRGKLLVLGITDNSIDTLFDRKINDYYRDSTLYVTLDSAKNVRFVLDYDKALKNYHSIDTTFTIGQLTDSPSVKLFIHKIIPNLITYSSKVVADLNGEEVNIQDAIVIVRDKIHRTDANGLFTVKLEDSLNVNDVIYIVKRGFSCYESKNLVNDAGIITSKFTITTADSLAAFNVECEMVNSINNWNYATPEHGEKIRGVNDRVVFKANRIPGKRTNDSNFVIEGYYYFVSEYEAKGDYAYHFFTGWLDSQDLQKTKAPYKMFEIESYDLANNKQKIYGQYQRSGRIGGFISDIGGQVAVFGPYQEQK